jgi:hypothetical protein
MLAACALRLDKRLATKVGATSQKCTKQNIEQIFKIKQKQAKAKARDHLKTSQPLSVKKKNVRRTSRQTRHRRQTHPKPAQPAPIRQHNHPSRHKRGPGPGQRKHPHPIRLLQSCILLHPAIQQSPKQPDQILL